VLDAGGRITGKLAQHRALAIAVAVLASSGLVAFSGEARACTYAPLSAYTLDHGSGDTAPPLLSAANISIMRAPGDSNGADCRDLGSYTITVDASDDETGADDLGFSVALVEGSVPFEVPDGDVEPSSSGSLSSPFPDDRLAFQGTLEVRVVDRAGNRSDPILVSASGDDMTEDEGCSCSAAGAPSRSYGAFMGLAGLLLLNRRTRARVRPVPAP